MVKTGISATVPLEALTTLGLKISTLSPKRTTALTPNAADADGAEFEQVVSVESFVAKQTITMTGIFSLPDLPSIDPTDKNKTKKNFAKFGKTLKDPTGTAGTGGERGGAGGAIFISVGRSPSSERESESASMAGVIGVLTSDRISARPFPAARAGPAGHQRLLWRILRIRLDVAQRWPPIDWMSA